MIQCVLWGTVNGSQFALGGHAETFDAPAFLEQIAPYRADGLLLQDISKDDETHEIALHALKQLRRELDMPLYLTGPFSRLEDIKKYLYTGAAEVCFPQKTLSGNIEALFQEGVGRFGEDRVTVWNLDESSFFKGETLTGLKNLIQKNSRLFILPGQSDQMASIKKALIQEGCDISDPLKLFPWEKLKKDPQGLVTVVVQDVKTEAVLMVAYMNQEAYEKTCETGMMTYFSRSRNSLWIKGLTSGHYQYVKSLTADCDGDTLLARVHQVGNACHTGAYSCFFQEIIHHPVTNKPAHQILQDTMAVILDRKAHPKEGAYTNYLFDKGIDKILKKVGEEATEIVIAAKNPEPEEIKYEIADFLYHVMVLMAQTGVSWEDVLEELANR